MSSTPDGFTFSDLFAGVGGFHAALHAAGGRWVFASEIDPHAARVYDYNWLRPLRESGALPPEGVERFEVSGDIVPLTDPAVKVPKSDVLAAGFPCQPFSKSGKQLGMDETRGTLFWNIARILQDEDRRPAVVLLENVRNLAGPRHRDTTFKTIVRTLRQLGYRTADEPAIFSPHLLPPELGGRPQVRERVFILAHYVGQEAAECEENFDDPIVTQKSFAAADWAKSDWDLARDLPLLADAEVDPKYELESSERKWIETWDGLLTEVAARLEPGERLPGFPIWADEFRTVAEAEDIIEIAELRGEPIPDWKANFLRKNAEFYQRHRAVLDRYKMEIDAFPPSRRKFEWQAGPHVPLEETIMHFRPSGIRCQASRLRPGPRRDHSDHGARQADEAPHATRDCPAPGPRRLVRVQAVGRRKLGDAGRPEGSALVQADGQRGERRRGFPRVLAVRARERRGDPDARRCGGERGHQRWLRGASAPPLDLRQPSTIGRCNEVRSHLGVDVLPDPQDPPPGGTQCGVSVTVPGTVQVDLPAPPFGVRLRRHVVVRAAVPEAPVDEDREPGAGEGDVDGSSAVSWNLDLHTEPEPSSMECLPKCDLGFGVAPCQDRHPR